MLFLFLLFDDNNDIIDSRSVIVNVHSFLSENNISKYSFVVIVIISFIYLTFAHFSPLNFFFFHSKGYLNSTYMWYS